MSKVNEIILLFSLKFIIFKSRLMSSLKKKKLSNAKTFKLTGNIKSKQLHNGYSSIIIWYTEINSHRSSLNLASVSNDKSIKIWDLNGTGKCALSIDAAHCRLIHCVAFLSNTNELATGGDRLDNSIKIWSLNEINFGNSV